MQKIILEPKTSPAKYAVIWLHGLGADGYDFVPFVPQLNIQEQYGVRFIFPTAPKIPVSINNNNIMTAWYNIYSFDKHGPEDNKGIEASRKTVNNLIFDEYKKGIAFNNIILAGFSQGGVIALYTALKFEHPLGGVLGLSCYIPQFDQDYHLNNKTLKIFLAHGRDDTVVNYAYGLNVQQKLQELNYNCKLFSYPIGHTVCFEEVEDIKRFLKTIIAN